MGSVFSGPDGLSISVAQRSEISAINGTPISRQRRRRSIESSPRFSRAMGEAPRTWWSPRTRDGTPAGAGVCHACRSVCNARNRGLGGQGSPGGLDHGRPTGGRAGSGCACRGSVSNGLTRGRGLPTATTATVALHEPGGAVNGDRCLAWWLSGESVGGRSARDHKESWPARRAEGRSTREGRTLTHTTACITV